MQIFTTKFRAANSFAIILNNSLTIWQYEEFTELQLSDPLQSKKKMIWCKTFETLKLVSKLLNVALKVNMQRSFLTKLAFIYMSLLSNLYKKIGILLTSVQIQ